MERLYTRLAPVYGFWGALTETRARARALEVAKLAKGQTVLEVAVGTGAFFATLAQVPGLDRLVGLDLAVGMVCRAAGVLRAKSDARVFLCRADARRLPFASGAFDVLFNCYLLDLLPESDIPEALVEFRRVLKPSGRAVLLVMATQAKVSNAIWMRMYKISPSLVGGCRPIPIESFLAWSGWQVDLREQISQIGFRSELFLARPAAIPDRSESSSKRASNP